MSDDTAAAAPPGATMGEQRWIAVYDGHWWLIEHEGGGIVAEGIQKEDAERIVSDHNELQEARAALAAMTAERDLAVEQAVYHRVDAGKWSALAEDVVSKLYEARKALAAMTALAERRGEALQAAKMPHTRVEGDPWFTCPIAWREDNEGWETCFRCDGDPACRHGCECPAEEHNARIDAALSEPPAGESET